MYNVKYWAIKKWQWIVDNWDYELEDYEINHEKMCKAIPRLKEFKQYCSYCEFYGGICEMCSLHTMSAICCAEYNNWLVAIKKQNTTMGNRAAKKMLKRIKADKTVFSQASQREVMISMEKILQRELEDMLLSQGPFGNPPPRTDVPVFATLITNK